MAAEIDRHLDEMAARGQADRRNGSYARHLLTELGNIELCVPRTRRYSSLGVVRAYARRARQLDRMILACFVLGLSTRKVATALLPVLGRRISAATVSQVAKTLDAAVTAFHGRPLKGPVSGSHARRGGAGAQDRGRRHPPAGSRRPRPAPGWQEGDHRLAPGHRRVPPSGSSSHRSLPRRGLSGHCLEMICVDGGSGLLAALPIVYPGIAIQRCWAHKIRNVLNKVRKADQPSVKADLHAVMNAKTLPQARSAARRFANRWKATLPEAVRCLQNDLDDLLTCWRYKALDQRKRVRTTNAIERRFREVRRRTRPMGVFQDRTSMDRILFAVFTHENANQGVPTLFSLTQNI
jgi:transposase-like protein